MLLFALTYLPNISWLFCVLLYSLFVDTRFWFHYNVYTRYCALRSVITIWCMGKALYIEVNEGKTDIRLKRGDTNECCCRIC